MQFVSSVFNSREGDGMEELTIKEAALFTGKSEGLLYRYIREGRLTVQSCSVKVQGKFKEIKKLKKTELIEFFGFNSEQLQNNGRTPTEQVQNNYSKNAEQLQSEFRTGDALTRDTIKEVISEYFQDRDTQLMKPLEELATYRVGKLEAENKFLQEKLETVLQENKLLQDNIKALPDRQEVESQEKKILEQSENIRILQKEKEIIMDLREQVDKEKGELEIKMEELQEGQKAEIQSLKEEEKNYIATIEELKRRLEDEEKKPWWKKIF